MMEKEEIRKKIYRVFDILHEQISWEKSFLEDYKKFLKQYEIIYFLIHEEKEGIKCAKALNDLLYERKVYFISTDPQSVGKELFHGILCYGIEEMFGSDWHKSVIVICSLKYKQELWSIINRECYQTLDKLKHAAVCKELVNYILENSEESEELCGTSIKQYISLEDKIFQVFDLLEDNFSRYILYRIIATRFLKQDYSNAYMADIFIQDINFPKEIHQSLSEKEVFIDCGAYPGDVSSDFIRFSQNKYNRIYMFELDEGNYSYLKLQSKFCDERITLLNQGLGSRNYKTQYIRRGNFHSATIDYFNSRGIFLDYGELPIETCYIKSLDSLKKEEVINEMVTFIHINIPNVQEVLEGAAKILQEDRPKLAIRVNDHKLEVLKIVLYLKSIVPEYKFFIRHHSDLLKRTVLYAI